MVQGTRIWTATRRLAPLAVLALQACGSTEDDAAADAGGPDAETEYEVALTGSVGDGPIAVASLSVIASDGVVLSEAVGSEDATYSIDLKTKGKYFPLTIESRGGTDLVTGAPPGFTLRSVAADPRNNQTANINPFTTLAVASARQMSGGLTSANMSVALGNVMREFNVGLTSALSTDPMTTPIDDASLAEVVKATESLAEVFRRVHAGVGGTGATLDDVVDAIAGDLTDGVLDGNGAVATDRRVSAMTVVASAQVMLESMRNELEVDDRVVTGVLDEIVQQLASSPDAPLTDTRPVTTQMIAQARRGVDAARALGDTAELESLSAALDAVTAGMSAADVRRIVPADDAGGLDDTLSILDAASDAEVTAALTGTTPASEPPPVNAPPSISGTPVTAAVEGEAWSFTPAAVDPDGDALTFSVMGRPDWAGFEASTGRLSGTPASADVGAHGPIVVTVSDGTDSASLAPFTIDVAAAVAPPSSPPPPPPPSNTAPVIAGTPATTTVAGEFYSFQPTAADADGDTLTFSISGRPGWARFSASTGRLRGTPTAAGTYGPIVVTVSDGTDSASLAPFSITVAAAPEPTPQNRAPVISGSPATHIEAGTTYSFMPSASDPDGDSLTFAISGRPAWASFSSSTGRLIGTPSSANVGNFGPIVISVSDGAASASLAAFSITVEAADVPEPPNQAPVISGTPPTNATVGVAYSFTPSASDADSDTLTFSIAGRPAWASFNTSTGRLSGTPTSAGTYGPISISVGDGTDSRSLAPFSIAVAAPASGSATLSWTPPTANTDGSPLTNLAGFRIRWGQQSGNYSSSATVMNPGLTTYVVDQLGTGTWYFVVLAVSAGGAESSPSNEASKTIN